ncbi:TRAP transporter small permease [Marinivivus vitaminiproducens]|uniref:TRAP transporter small permease n=1 Tax=Marinivivus vitaminiproducens TaxID=3035935 RepID=UPI0027AB0A40|nr:TRAP transporter small permease [Geminicoccaceae bacterium SCSIO 64248]
MTTPMRPYSLEGSLSAVLMAVLVLATAIQVIGRSAGGLAPVWTEEFARWIWIWLVFVGAAEVERTRGSLRMELVLNKLPERVGRAVNMAIDLVFCALLVHLIAIGYAMVMRTASYSSVTLPVPTAWLYAAFPIGGILILIRVARRLVGDARAFNAPQADRAETP